MNAEIYLTDLCNMGCTFCGAMDCNYGQSLKLETVKEFIAALHSLGYMYLSLSGGEPFLYGNLKEVIEYALENGLMVNVVTNGMKLDKDYIELIRGRRVSTRVSIHSLDRERFKSITTVDGLERVKESVRLLKDAHAHFGIGMTVLECCEGEVGDMADYAMENGAWYIRYTRAYRVGRGKNMDTDGESFERLLKSIGSQVLEKYERLDLGNATGMGRELLDMYLTRRCGAGTDAYIALKTDGKLVSCPLLMSFRKVPSQAFSGRRSIESMKSGCSAFISSIDPARLAVRCGKCIYKAACLGGCPGTKFSMERGLYDGQPVCIRQIVNKVLEDFDPIEQRRLVDYWNWQIGKSDLYARGITGCMRRLPIWELRFRRN